MFQQISLRLHPAGLLYLTVRFTTLKEAYNRSVTKKATQLLYESVLV